MGIAPDHHVSCAVHKVCSRIVVPIEVYLVGTCHPLLGRKAVSLTFFTAFAGKMSIWCLIEVSVIKDVLSGLTAREAKVLRMRFGINMNTDHTLEEVGKQFDVTRERIRQIEAKALRKLRHPSRSEQLRSFLDE